MHQFDYITREPKDIFAFYKIYFEDPQVDEILHDNGRRGWVEYYVDFA